MLAELLEELIFETNTAHSWKECREYEGEFESAQESMIVPDAALIEVEGDDNSEENTSDEAVNIRIIVVSRRMKKVENSTGALNLVDLLKDNLHNKYLETTGVDLFYKGFSIMGNLPGLKIYEVRFQATK